MINNIVIVLGEQGRDSGIHKHVFILSQTPLLSRLPHNIYQNSMYYIWSLLVIHFGYP